MMVESLSADSGWAPYFAVLPSSSDALIFWNEKELAYLGASAVRDKIGKESAEEMFHKDIETLGVPGLTLELFHKTASTIMAYAFDIPEEDGMEEDLDDQNEDDLVPDEERSTILSMIPLADMLNADADRNNARLVCDHKDLEMRSIKDIPKGEEILNDYGPLPRSDLLRRYGYISDRYAPYDVVEISTALVVSTFTSGGGWGRLSNGLPIKNLSSVDLEIRLDLAKREDIFEDSYDLCHASSEGPCIPDELIALLWLLSVDEETLSAIRHSSASVPSRSKMCTELIGDVFEHLLKEREALYLTTVEEDEEFLGSDPVRMGNVEYRHVAGCTIQYGEKLILREARQEASSFKGSNHKMRIDSKKRGAEDEDSITGKRSKGGFSHS